MTSPPATCIAPSRTIKATGKGGHCQLTSSLISVCSATQMCGVFSNGVLSFSYGGQTRTVTITYIVLGDSGAFFTNSLCGGKNALTIVLVTVTITLNPLST